MNDMTADIILSTDMITKPIFNLEIIVSIKIFIVYLAGTK